MNFPDFLKLHREKSGFKSQRELAKVTGISSATISRLESGEQKPALETINLLAKYLKSTNLSELLKYVGIDSEQGDVQYWKDRAIKAEEELKKHKLILKRINELIASNFDKSD